MVADEEGEDGARTAPTEASDAVTEAEAEAEADVAEGTTAATAAEAVGVAAAAEAAAAAEKEEEEEEEKEVVGEEAGARSGTNVRNFCCLRRACRVRSRKSGTSRREGAEAEVVVVRAG